MRLTAKPPKIVVRPVPRSDLVKIGDVVTGVAKGRLEHRIEPNRITADRSDIIELGGDTGQIPDSVAVRVVIALGINLIKDRCLKPLWSGRCLGN